MAQVVLITGTSSGLGAALAQGALARGHRVHATVRDTGKATRLQEAGATVHRMDVQQTDSVAAAVAAVLAAEGRIDTLINNAGAGFVRTTEQATEADIGWIMDVNFMGVVRTTKAVLPHMRRARSGRIINISSVGGLVGQPFNEVYCAAKFAVEGYTESLASYVGPAFGLHFTAVEPGGITSEFAASALRHLAATGGMIDDEYLPILATYAAGAQARGTANFQTPEEVAAIVLDVMEMAEPPIRLRTSDWGRALCDLKTRADPDGRLQQRLVRAMFLGD